MGSRLELQTLLEDIMYSLTNERNVYYNPPSNMRYPAIKFEPRTIDTVYADNIPYTISNCYSLTVMGRLPNDNIVTELLKLPMCSFDRHYTYDGLNHDVLKLYY